MWVLGLYRFYISAISGGLIYFFLFRSVWLWIGTSLLVRILWYAVERIVESAIIDRDFRRHISAFKQQMGPYGIRIANSAENSRSVKRSLAEVFVSNPEKLKKTLDRLEAMDMLFSAGMRPDGDQYLLHDLKLKYCRMRLNRKSS